MRPEDVESGDCVVTFGLLLNEMLDASHGSSGETPFLFLSLFSLIEAAVFYDRLWLPVNQSEELDGLMWWEADSLTKELRSRGILGFLSLDDLGGHQDLPARTTKGVELIGRALGWAGDHSTAEAVVGWAIAKTETAQMAIQMQRDGPLPTRAQQRIPRRRGGHREEWAGVHLRDDRSERHG